MWRAENIKRTSRRFAETLLVCVLTSVLAFSLPLVLPCAEAFANSTVAGSPALAPPNPLVHMLDDILCDEGLHSGLGAMTLSSHEHAIKVSVE